MEIIDVLQSGFYALHLKKLGFGLGFRHNDEHDQIDEDAPAETDKGKDDEQNPGDGRVDVEIGGQTARHAAHHTIIAIAVEFARATRLTFRCPTGICCCSAVRGGATIRLPHPTLVIKLLWLPDDLYHLLHIVDFHHIAILELKVQEFRHTLFDVADNFCAFLFGKTFFNVGEILTQPIASVVIDVEDDPAKIDCYGLFHITFLSIRWIFTPLPCGHPP